MEPLVSFVVARFIRAIFIVLAEIMGIYKEVKSCIERYKADNLIDSSNLLVVAVSGGYDSLALLHVLAKRPIYPAENLIVAHLDHGLRATSADEAKFVAVVAAEWGLACYVDRIEVAEEAGRKGQGLEEAGRKARYRFLADVARQVGATAVATAHNADDQVETVLMHLLRGSGLDGLKGMSPIGPMPEAAEIRLIRPLLKVRRSEIEAYCLDHELNPIVDASNADTTFFRNRVRHELLPILRDYNPEIDERLRVTTELVADDFDLLDEIMQASWLDLLRESGRGWLRIDLDGWRNLPLALRRRSLRYAVSQIRSGQDDLGYKTIELARHVAESGQVGAQATLPGNTLLIVEYDTISIKTATGEEIRPNLPQLKRCEAQILAIPGQLELDHGWRLEAAVVEGIDPEMLNANHDPWLVYLNIGEQDILMVRPRAPGERFLPLGMGGRSAKISRMMIDRKVPAALRERWPVVANEEHLLWLVGQHMDERGRVTSESRRVLRLRVYLKS